MRVGILSGTRHYFAHGFTNVECTQVKMQWKYVDYWKDMIFLYYINQKPFEIAAFQKWLRPLPATQRTDII